MDEATALANGDMSARA